MAKSQKSHLVHALPVPIKEKPQTPIVKAMFDAALSGDHVTYRELGTRLVQRQGMPSMAEIAITFLLALEVLQKDRLKRIVVNPWDDRMVLVRAEALPPLMSDAHPLMEGLRRVWLSGDPEAAMVFLDRVMSDLDAGSRVIGELGAWLYLTNSDQLDITDLS